MRFELRRRRDGGPRPAPRAGRAIRVLALLLWGIVLAVGAYWTADALWGSGETARTTARFEPPVWAGQNVPGACSGGFYARQGTTIVLTIVAHCAIPGRTLTDGDGRTIGIFGPMAQLTDCPVNRFCAPSDFLTLALAADRIPWGHLNVVDMGAGGYRTFEPGTRPLACADIEIGDKVEIDGREHYRTGKVISRDRYEHETDTIFPCLAIADIPVGIGDSGGAVLVNGAPGGVISRQIGGRLGFTPLAEGLDNLGLVLCTTPDCDLSPASAVQPGG